MAFPAIYDRLNVGAGSNSIGAEAMQSMYSRRRQEPIDCATVLVGARDLPGHRILADVAGRAAETLAVDSRRPGATSRRAKPSPLLLVSVFFLSLSLIFDYAMFGGGIPICGRESTDDTAWPTIVAERYGGGDGVMEVAISFLAGVGVWELRRAYIHVHRRHAAVRRTRMAALATNAETPVPAASDKRA
mmetsp:Transcript_25239/g.72768  ORF Transcript_25239/g.72768 Transcript_25239/m.72768 type:complete len:189 (-) Transcript_25239:70-636(-)|eukprot:CAMPEP_0170281146 /NCGR_PEP_ID=MMETSP0116_2-20130129/40592_1 /TAXON_ID=400756 /ORGANISM="Durinskia baltica, Strain CSIRO CS-38" /LENGTH=188 /DNA_ID=CAMNT_0010532487 /DNA_START=62 /DNA_END=628 /DNA_ORIENTATION=+